MAFLRTYLAYLLVVGPILGAYTIFVSNQTGAPSPTWRVIAGGALLITLGVTLLAEWFWAPIHRLARQAEKAAAEDSRNLQFPEYEGDVGRLVRAFRQILRRRHSLLKKRERARERLMIVLNHIGDGVIILNKSGRVRLMNPAAERLLHAKFKDSRNSTFIRVVRDHRIAEVWQRCVETEREESRALEFADDRFIRIIITPFTKGVARGYLITMQDLTEVRYLQRVRQDFVSNVSHELRTPLASLRALAETLSDGALEDPPAAQRFLERIEVEVDAMTQMVQELLDLSRIESGKASLNRRPVSVGEAVISPVERLYPQAQRARIELSVHVPSDLPDVFIDAGRIQQVVINLVHNAIKFTPPGGGITVNAHQHHEEEHVVVSVADTGAGIPEEDLPRVFERFYKSDRARSGGGTGLGLAIAKHIVQAHGGEIWVESIEGQGCTFYFSLPLASAIEDEPDGAAEPEVAVSLVGAEMEVLERMQHIKR